MNITSHARVCCVEALETRIAPARIFGIDGNNGLFSFDSATPGTLSATTPITGLGAGELIKAMDFRPATGELYGIAISGAGTFTGRLYEIDPTTAVATAVGAAFSTTLTTATGYGMDFNPTVDRIRVTNLNELNIRLNPDTGAIAATDTNITGAASIAALAYSNNYAGAASTTLYAVDYNSDGLFKLGGLNSNPSPNGGVATKIANISVTTDPGAENALGLDILTTLEGNTAFYMGRFNLAHRLYTLDLATGAATLAGAIGGGTTPVFDIAVQPEAFTFTAGKSFTYTDGDGDLVTVKTSAGTLDLSQFSWLASADGTRRELTQMNIAGDATFTKANLTFTAKKTTTGGDGRVDVGFIVASGVNLGAVKIGGNLERIAVGTNDAVIPAMKSFGALSMSRSFGGDDSAIVASDIDGGVPLFKIKGDIHGVGIIVKKAGTVTIGGSIIGGGGQTGGTFSTGEGVKSFTLGGSVVAGDSPSTGVVNLGGKSGVVKIGGSIIGGDHFSGSVAVDATSFTLGGSIIGGTGNVSGSLIATTSGALKIGGSIIAGSGQQSAGATLSAGGALTIGGSIVGGEGAFSALVNVTKSSTVLIGGSINTSHSTTPASGSIFFATAKTVTIKGGLIGNEDAPAIIGFGGKLNPTTAAESIAIGSLTIGGSVIHGQILIGSPNMNVNAGAGKITIGGDFLASSISAGFTAGADTRFGTNDDAPAAMGTLPDIKAAIGSIIIKGRANGTSSDGDHYGIIAESLGIVSIAGRKLTLTDAAQDNVPVGIHADLRVRELAIP